MWTVAGGEGFDCVGGKYAGQFWRVSHNDPTLEPLRLVRESGELQ